LIIMIPKSPGKRPLIICADDYALSPEVSRGIRELALARRISATSVMASMPFWPSEAAALKDASEHIDVGLHFTLTDQPSLGKLPVLAPGGKFLSYKDLLALSLRGRLPEEEIATELGLQLEAFESSFGRAPDFVDGHQHVHALPGVYPVFLRVIRERLDPGKCWLRDCGDRLPALWGRKKFWKAFSISFLGRGLTGQIRRLGLRANRGFSGFYSAEEESLAEALPGMLRKAGGGHLLMVHPGHIDDELARRDSLVSSRETEWSYLMSDEFFNAISKQDFFIARGTSC
jgi:predicted glycoside hydrolase/deacetylase ChbG (UPF0249 family)